MDFMTIMENFVIFISRDLIFKIAVPCAFVFLVFDIIGYMFSKKDKKEDLLDAFKAKAIGLVALVVLPFMLVWFVGFIGKMTGVDTNMDVSLMQRLIQINSKDKSDEKVKDKDKEKTAEKDNKKTE